MDWKEYMVAIKEKAAIKHGLHITSYQKLGRMRQIIDEMEAIAEMAKVVCNEGWIASAVPMLASEIFEREINCIADLEESEITALLDGVTGCNRMLVRSWVLRNREKIAECL